MAFLKLVGCEILISSILVQYAERSFDCFCLHDFLYQHSLRLSWGLNPVGHRCSVHMACNIAPGLISSKDYFVSIYSGQFSLVF